ncbi:MAG: hypothetical protein IKY45_05020 [Clostridia bacterium]|nr:hypothetical protein [Clostridia bacterium]
MEYENKYASKGVAGTGLGLGIAGTALGLMAGGLNGTGLFNGGNCNGGCSEDHFVNRYELDMESKLVAKDSEIALLKSNIYTDQKIADVYERLNTKIGCLEGQLSQQSVVNAQITANISCMQSAINTLQSLTKTVVPIDNVCPAPMPQYNSWTAPTTTTGA